MKRNLKEFFRTPNASRSSSLMLYYAGHEKCLPGHTFGPAVRAQYLLHFILDGKGEFHVCNHIYNLSKNQAFIIKPGESSYYLADALDPWEYIWFAFDGADVTRILQDCNLLGDVPFASYTLDDRLLDTFTDTIEQLQNKTENEYILLGNLFHVFGHLSRSRYAADVEDASLYLKHAINFICNNYRNDIKVQDIANYVQIERSYLYRLFINKFHCSPKQYLIQYRLQMATDLLTNSDLNTTEISYECGFGTPSAFCKYFREHTGFTPKRYRTIDGEKTLSYVPTRESIGD
ncbi:MAG: AraC family transcriptional regulator [Angelakisella sp.]